MKKKDYYFTSLIDLMDYACQAAELLDTICDSYGERKIAECLDDMHKIEHDADLKRHEVSAQLIKEFITPIEREDLASLINTIDDVTDAIEDVVRLMAIYDIRSLRREVFEFVPTIAECCNSVRAALNELSNFRKSTLMDGCLIRINELEEKGDRIHFTALKNLFAQRGDPIETLSWQNLYEAMEKCCDTCESVSDVIESIRMKNA